MKKPRPTKAIGRKRRTLGWTLLTLGLLVAGVWVAGGWWRLGIEGPMWWVGAERGLVFLNRNERPPSATPPRGAYALLLRPHRRGCHLVVPKDEYGRIGKGPGGTWRYWGILMYANEPGTSQDITVAFAFTPILLWTSAALLLRSGYLARRRAMTGACATCGYSLAGLGAGAPCPECGKLA